jgi:hypothetical protein
MKDNSQKERENLSGIGNLFTDNIFLTEKYHEEHCLQYICSENYKTGDHKELVLIF